MLQSASKGIFLLFQHIKEEEMNIIFSIYFIFLFFCKGSLDFNHNSSAST